LWYARVSLVSLFLSLVFFVNDESVLSIFLFIKKMKTYDRNVLID